MVLLDLDLGAFGDGMRLIEPIARAGANVVVVVTGSTDAPAWGGADRGRRAQGAARRPSRCADVLATVRRLTTGLPVMDSEEREELLAAVAGTGGARTSGDGSTSSAIRETEVLGHLMRAAPCATSPSATQSPRRRSAPR